MTPGSGPSSNNERIPTGLIYARFSFHFIHLLKITGGFVLTTLLLVLLVGLGFVSGSIWILSAAIGALVVKLFPITLVFIAIVGAAYLAFHYYQKR
jgi:hypothetical protein